jgi:UDP-N-acetylmuramate--alanine ligase
MVKNNFHIIGICGIGMSAIAQILKSSGYNVQGSDKSPGYMKDKLESQGIKVFICHNENNINDADIVIRSTAVDDNNIELISARNKNKPILSRYEILKKILENKYVIAISGCHGKTTTTNMIGEIFTNAGLDPTIICGGIMNKFKNNVKIGKSKIYIVEADESDDTFNKIHKDFAVLTNIGADHLDFHGDINNIYTKFLQFVDNINSVVPNDDKILQLKNKEKLIIYDLNLKTNQNKITNIQNNGWQTNFDYEFNNELYKFILNAPGEHNINNAAAAISCAKFHNIDINIIQDALKNFYGVKRRLSFIGMFRGNKVIDDYAHHPDEIIAGLKTMSKISEELIAVIQPHRYTRVQAFFDQYIESFRYAKNIFLLDVFAAGEQDNGFNTKKLYDFCVKNNIKNVMLANDFNDLQKKIIEVNQKNGLIIFMGAGDITNLAHKLAE